MQSVPFTKSVLLAFVHRAFHGKDGEEFDTLAVMVDCGPSYQHGRQPTMAVRELMVEQEKVLAKWC